MTYPPPRSPAAPNAVETSLSDWLASHQAAHAALITNAHQLLQQSQARLNEQKRIKESDQAIIADARAVLRKSCELMITSATRLSASRHWTAWGFSEPTASSTAVANMTGDGPDHL